MRARLVSGTVSETCAEVVFWNVEVRVETPPKLVAADCQAAPSLTVMFVKMGPAGRVNRVPVAFRLALRAVERALLSLRGSGRSRDAGQGANGLKLAEDALRAACSGAGSMPTSVAVALVV